MHVAVILAIYVIVGGLALAIFLWGKPDGNSVFDRLYRLVCVHFPRSLKWCVGKCCGPRGPKALDATYQYICYTNNPIVQIFYLTLAIGGYLAFVLYGYPHIPNPQLDAYHKYIGLGIFMASLSVWWMACNTDPGTVTEDNVDAYCEAYEWDNQIFAKGECSTCKIDKPARSKHCSLCRKCVVKFDHHCIWINNCVGAGNHKYFLGFLFVNLVLCSYGAVLGGMIIWGIMEEKNIFNAVFVDPDTKEKFEATYVIIFQYMLATEGMILAVAALCATMSVVLGGFYLWHLNLVRMGTTTNELSKWKYLKYYLKNDVGDEGKETLKQLRNIYNQGFFRNMGEIIRPIDVSKMPSAQVAKEPKEGSQEKEEKDHSSNGEVKKAKKPAAKKEKGRPKEE